MAMDKHKRYELSLDPVEKALHRDLIETLRSYTKDPDVLGMLLLEQGTTQKFRVSKQDGRDAGKTAFFIVHWRIQTDNASRRNNSQFVC